MSYYLLYKAKGKKRFYRFSSRPLLTKKDAMNMKRTAIKGFPYRNFKVKKK